MGFQLLVSSFNKRVLPEVNGSFSAIIFNDLIRNVDARRDSMTNDKAAPASGSIMVVGGGIAGLTTAIEAAEVGYEVFLVEKNPYLGGRVAQLNQYFPKLCPPTCGLEINFRRIKDNPRIKVFTLAEVEKVDGTPGNYNVSLKINPRYVNENCTCCGDCAEACDVEVSDPFNLGMGKKRALICPLKWPFRLASSCQRKSSARMRPIKPRNL